MSSLTYLPNTIAEGMYKVLVPSETMRMVEANEGELGSCIDAGSRLMSRTDLLLTLGRLKCLTGLDSVVSFKYCMASFGFYGAVVWEKV